MEKTQEKLREILEMIRKAGEIIQEHERSRAFKDLIITVGVESIVTLAEEGIRELNHKDGGSPGK